MSRIIRAKVIGGMLEPLGGADLPEGAEVVLAVIGSADLPAEAAFLGSAGSWDGLVDSEALISNIYADRLVSTRGEPAL